MKIKPHFKKVIVWAHLSHTFYDVEQNSLNMGNDIIKIGPTLGTHIR